VQLTYKTEGSGGQMARGFEASGQKEKSSSSSAFRPTNETDLALEVLRFKGFMWVRNNSAV
jgi:hypothetical protein